MPLIVTYVDKHKNIVEFLVCFVECEHGTSGSQLATLIESTYIDIGFDTTLC